MDIEPHESKETADLSDSISLDLDESENDSETDDPDNSFSESSPIKLKDQSARTTDSKT